MAIEIKVPTVGESISEVIIGEWLKPVGSQVALDEILVSLETDKVNVEVPAPAAGVISKVLKANGETARVGEVIGYIEGAATADKSAKAAPATAPAAPAEPPAATAKTTEPRVMPAAARVLGQAGVAAAAATGTGPGGRVMKEDAIRTLSQGQKIPLVYTTAPVPGSPEARQAEQIALASAAKPAESPAPALEVAETPPTGKPPAATEVLAPVAALAAETTGARREELVPMSPLRKRVAQRLVEAQHTAAILTTFNECDMSAVMELRKRHQDDFLAKHGVKLGFMSFFIKACVDALKAWPSVNAQIRGTDIAYQHFYDIGVAVGGGKGLVVPVVRNADQLGFAEIEKKLTDLGTRAKAGTLKLEELQGGTFSISNGGVYGSMLSTPILNPPQSGILGMHNIISRPIGVDGQVVLRPMMYLALSYDHRLVDGREAVSFLIHVKKCIEAPERLLLGL